MLQTKLTTEPGDDIKGAYVKNGDVWELDKLAADHPVLIHNTTLKNEKAAEETKANDAGAKLANAERERDDARAKALPNGHRAVPIEIADLGNAAKTAGFTKDELPTVKEKITGFETEKAQSAERANKTRAFEFAGVKNIPAALNLKAADDLKIEWKNVDGKDTPYLVGEQDGKPTEVLFDGKLLSERDGFKDYAPTLFGKESGRSFDFGRQGGKDDLNEYDQIRNEVKAEQKGAKATDANSILAALSGQTA